MDSSSSSSLSSTTPGTADAASSTVGGFSGSTRTPAGLRRCRLGCGDRTTSARGSGSGAPTRDTTQLDVIQSGLSGEHRSWRSKGAPSGGGIVRGSGREHTRLQNESKPGKRARRGGLLRARSRPSFLPSPETKEQAGVYKVGEGRLDSSWFAYRACMGT